MNIQDYLNNPMGKGSSVLMLSASRESLDSQYEKLSLRMSVKWFMLNKKYYIAHVKIPSRKHDKLYYDVLLQFDTSSFGDSIVINHADMKIFSNCPSFTYTYAYVCNEKDQLINWTRSKYNRNILRKNPESRNPNEILNYERSIYLACKFITSNSRNYISRIKLSAVKATNHQNILMGIRTNEEIENLYKEYDNIIQREKEKTTKKKDTPKSSVNTNHKKGSTSSSSTKKTRTTSKTKTTKKTKHI